ncbi:glycogen debranching N-terminal domain-containing protein [Phycicoccus ginsengisoli]
MATRSRQPWLHDLVIAVDGNATVLSGAGGDIALGGVQGLWVDDERVLSRLELEVAGEEPSPVAAEARGATAVFLGAARGLGDPGADSTVEVRRLRTVSGTGLCERVVVTSRASQAVRAVVRTTLAADGAQVAEVKSGPTDGAQLVPSAQDGRATWQTSRHAVAVTAEPAAQRLGAGADHAVLEHELVLEPGGEAEVVLTVHVERTTRSLFDSDPGAEAVSWAGIRVQSDDPRLAPLVRQSLDDLRHLLQRDPEQREHVFAAAGSPWYLTLFGRDSLWTARMLLPFGTELAAGTLWSLARRQGAKDDPATAEQPGKIPHEVRRTAYDGGRAGGLRLPPLYYGTVDATALWVVLLVEAWRWGLPEREARALLPHLEAALTWLTTDGQPGDAGLLTYVDPTGHGLANQGWKDSADSMRRLEGSIAPAPIALVEAQAYAVQALAAAADLLDALGAEGADHWRTEGVALADRLRERFWVERGGHRYLAMALDATGAPVDGLGSNMGHVLATGALTPEEARSVADTLTGPALLDRFGVRSMSTDTGGFNPIGYHTGSIWTHDTAICALGLSREGFGDLAGTLARALVASGEAFDLRWPELYSGEVLLDRPTPYPASCRPQAWSAASAAALLTVALGLDADVPAGELRLAPVRPGPFGALRVDGLRWGDVTFSVAVARDGSTRVEGLPDSVSVVVTE